MKNFEKYYDFIKDEETKNEVKKIDDKAKYVSKNFISVTSDFINPYVADISVPVINNYDIKFGLFPSYEYGERKVFILYPDFIDIIDEDEFIVGLRIRNKSKFKKLNHKDYLGAIMSLGIDRNKTGDIYVYDDYADVLIHKDISDYIFYNLEKIWHNKIEIEIIKIDDVNYKEQEYELLNIVSSSLRLDNVVKHLMNKSREIASDIIRGENVKINWQVEDRISTLLEENDLLSIKRYGRFKIQAISTNKNGKYRLEVKRYA